MFIKMMSTKHCSSRVTTQKGIYMYVLANKLRRENAVQHKHYKQFVLENPDTENLPSRQRHEQFRDWLRSRDEVDPE